MFANNLELVNANKMSGQSALHVAVSNSRLDLVKTLLKHGADVNSQDKGNKSKKFQKKKSQT